MLFYYRTKHSPLVSIDVKQSWSNPSLNRKTRHLFVCLWNTSQYFQDIFSTFTVTSSHETMLAGNQWIEDLSRLVWKSESSSSQEEPKGDSTLSQCK